MDQATSSARRGVGAKRQCQDSGDGCFIRYGCGLDYWLCHSFSSKKLCPILRNLTPRLTRARAP